MEDGVIEREREQVTDRPEVPRTEYRYTPPPPDRANLNLNDFLNPRSMLTPGVAGSLVMLIANTLWVQFMIPQKWSAITLSFVLIIPVLMRFSASALENVIYFVFNGLIVFALAVNTNFVGAKLQQISGVTVQASLDNQKIDNIQKTNNIQNIQLASNEDQSIQNLRFYTDSQGQGGSHSDSSKEKEKKREDRNKGGSGQQNKNDRKFFQKWF